MQTVLLNKYVNTPIAQLHWIAMTNKFCSLGSITIKFKLSSKLALPMN